MQRLSSHTRCVCFRAPFLIFCNIFLKFTFYWKIITLQNFAVFCQPSTWISLLKFFCNIDKAENFPNLQVLLFDLFFFFLLNFFSVSLFYFCILLSAAWMIQAALLILFLFLLASSCFPVLYFCCRAKWISYTYTYTAPLFWVSFPFGSPQSMRFPVLCSRFSFVICANTW